MLRARITHLDLHGRTVEVLRKRIKHLYVRVLPPDGRVSVSAPLRLSERRVRQAVMAKWPWITRQQARLAAHRRQPRPEYLSGDIHYHLGQPYHLHVVEGPARSGAELSDGRINLVVHPGSDATTRERVLWDWYRRQLKGMLPPLVGKWEAVIGVRVAECRVRRMRTRWGSCNVKARRIWVNLALATRPVRCLEYIVVHEMVHLLERRHNDRFRAHMDRFLPQWRVYRQELLSAPLDGATAQR